MTRTMCYAPIIYKQLFYHHNAQENHSTEPNGMGEAA